MPVSWRPAAASRPRTGPNGAARAASACWTETGLLERFSGNGLRVAWRTAIHGGYAGPAVAGGRVFITDARRDSGSRMIERAIAIDEADGRVLWTREWEANYSGLETIFAVGPRATPTVDGNRVYVLGTMGNLLALDVGDGRVLWQKNFVQGLRRLGAVVGHDVGAAGGRRPADRRRRRRAEREGDGVQQAHRRRDLARAVVGLGTRLQPAGDHRGRAHPAADHLASPRRQLAQSRDRHGATGKFPYEVDLGITVATPVHSGDYLLVSSLYNSARMLKLDVAAPAATLAWRGDNESISALMSTPVVDGKYIYGMSGGELACWELETGKRIWRSRELMKERTAFSTAFIVRNGDRYFINTERGDLVIARLSPAGYEEISRATLIEPTHPNARRQDLGPIHWSHPAYANRHIFVRNDKEILKASIARE